MFLKYLGSMFRLPLWLRACSTLCRTSNKVESLERGNPYKARTVVLKREQLGSLREEFCSREEKQWEKNKCFIPISLSNT